MFTPVFVSPTSPIRAGCQLWACRLGSGEGSGRVGSPQASSVPLAATSSRGNSPGVCPGPRQPGSDTNNGQKSLSGDPVEGSGQGIPHAQAPTWHTATQQGRSSQPHGKGAGGRQEVKGGISDDKVRGSLWCTWDRGWAGTPGQGCVLSTLPHSLRAPAAPVAGRSEATARPQRGHSEATARRWGGRRSRHGQAQAGPGQHPMLWTSLPPLRAGPTGPQEACPGQGRLEEGTHSPRCSLSAAAFLETSRRRNSLCQVLPPH